MSKGTISGGGTDGYYDVSIKRKDGDPITMSAYCCDLTEDLTGDVGVIEIAGDLDKGVNIYPGYSGDAAYNATRDGELKQIQKFPDTKPVQEVFWNWAMRPGWQKWKPNYRYGVITAIDTDADTCDVNLDECLGTDTPDGRSMDINQGTSLSAIPIEYMNCNSAAFEVGDEVVVKFEGNVWGGAKVIGFKEEPKACWWEDWREGLCNVRDWWAYAAGNGVAQIPDYPSNALCPGLPFSGTSEWAGVSTVSWQTGPNETGIMLFANSAFVFTGKWILGDNVVDTGVRIEPSSKIKIKGTGSGYIQLTDGSSMEQILIDLTGEALEIDLASYGMADKEIEGITIGTETWCDPPSLSIDYITFL